MSDGESRISSTLLMAGALLLVLVAGLFFHNLGAEDVGSDGEASVILTTREMIRNHAWIVPSVGGHNRWEKPPLYFWAVKIAAKFNDNEVTPFVARVPGALSMLLLVLLAAWWMHQHLTRYPRADTFDITPESYALLAGLMIASSPEIFNLARQGLPDSTFAFLCFAAMYCLGESFETRRSFYAGQPWRHWVLGAYFLLGLAMLTKGPIAYLFVIIPYMATCWAYKMRRPDWIHLPGLLLALAVGGWWYAAAIGLDPEAKSVFADELIAKRFGQGVLDAGPVYYYARLAIVSFFPWILLAGVMAWRNLRRTERTPTLMTWSCGLLSGVIWLSLIGTKRADYFLPVAPLILLLAVDALARWNFDSRPGTAFWVLVRSLRWLGIALAIPYSLWVSSDLGVALAAGLAVFAVILAIHRYRTTYTYAVWERTVHASAMLVTLFIAAEIYFVEDYLPRKGFLSRNRAFIEEVKSHVPADAELYYYGPDDSTLSSYLMGRLLPITRKVDELIRTAGSNTYLLTDSDYRQLSANPELVPLVTRYGDPEARPRSALFKIVRLPPGPAQPSMVSRYQSVPPMRLAAIGDPARGDRDAQKEIAKRLRKLTEAHTLDGVLILGSPTLGDTPMERIDFARKFERPYGELIDRGVPFYGLLGDGDLQSRITRLALSHYPLLQMRGEQSYATDLYGGLVRLYMIQGHQMDEQSEQWARLESDLMGSAAPWKIVAVYTPLLSFAARDEVKKSLAKRLLPLLDRAKVQLVLTSAEPWYQRIHDPEHFPVFAGTGWSGKVKQAEFQPDARLLARYDRKEGLLAMEIGTETLRLRAINRDGEIVDSAVVSREGGLLAIEPSAQPEETKPGPATLKDAEAEQSDAAPRSASGTP